MGMKTHINRLQEYEQNKTKQKKVAVVSEIAGLIFFALCLSVCLSDCLSVCLFDYIMVCICFNYRLYITLSGKLSLLHNTPLFSDTQAYKYIQVSTHILRGIDSYREMFKVYNCVHIHTYVWVSVCNA